MELRQLEYFMVVSEKLHFTRAAEKLYISQPTLSEQIRHLEKEVGMPLFDRIGKKIALTEAGNLLFAHSKRVFFELEQAQAAIRDLNEIQRGKLTIGSLLTCVHYLLPPAIIDFKRLYPNIKLSVQGLRSGDIKKGLLENELDLGITFLPVEEEELESIPLFDEELTLVVPADHPFAKLKEVEMKSLEDVPTILLPENYFLRQLIDIYSKELGITLKPTLEITTLESLVQMVAKGIGATILPAPYIDFLNDSRLSKIKLIHPTPQRHIGFIYRKNKFMCAATKAFINQIRETSRTFS